MAISIPPVTRTLLLVNIAIYAVQSFTGPMLILPFALWPPASPQFPGAPSFEIWQLLTYGFLHGGLNHLFFNMLALYMFGGDVERLLGSRRYLQYYLACVVGAAVAQLIVVGTMDRSPVPTLGRLGGRLRLAAGLRHGVSAATHHAAVSPDTDARVVVRDVVWRTRAVSRRDRLRPGRRTLRASWWHGRRLCLARLLAESAPAAHLRSTVMASHPKPRIARKTEHLIDRGQGRSRDPEKSDRDPRRGPGCSQDAARLGRGRSRPRGLLETPRRVVDAYSDWFSGYEIDPREYLSRTFEETGGYDEMVVLRDIEFESHCEHHMAPIIGRAHVGYLPTGKVVGISKLARVVEVFARRLQVQEKMTAEIARCINEVLLPEGVGVVIEAVHECMTTRGIHKRGVSMITSKMLGSFRSDARTRNEFLTFIDIRDRR